MGFVVRRKGSTIDEAHVKEFVAKQVLFSFKLSSYRQTKLLAKQKSKQLNQVAPYKKLRRVCFIDSIPKNAPGEVLWKELIKLALSGVNSKLQAVFNVLCVW